MESVIKKQEDDLGTQNEFLEFYKNISSGYNRISFEKENLDLILIVGDISETIKTFHAKIDAWYLDGFSPSKNPEMWTNEIYSFMKSNSKKDATLSTYTTARFVRDGLTEAGFQIEKVPGFGNKKEMIKGQIPIIHNKILDKPWFRIPKITTANRQATIIGAGVAGTSIAYQLAQKDFIINIIEREEKKASSFTDSLAGMFAPLLTGDASDLSEWSFLAYNEFIKFLDTHADNFPGLFKKTGVFEIAKSIEEVSRLKKALTNSNFNSSDVTFLEGKDSLFNKIPGIFFPKAGWINPFLLTKAYLNISGKNINQYMGTSVVRLERENSKWKIYLSNEEILESEIVILANSFDAKDFFPAIDIIKKVRGQILFYPSNDFPSSFDNVILHDDGYIIPNKNGMHIVGSTFNPNDSNRELNLDHNIQLLEKLKNLIPEINPIEGRKMSGLVGFRAMSPDHLPVVGPVPDVKAFQQDYSDLWKANIYKDYPEGKYLPGLYISCAHGSKGILNSYLAANVLSSMITGENSVVRNDLLEKINPSRFLIQSFINRR